MRITLQNTASIEDNNEILHKSLTNILHRAPPMCAQLENFVTKSSLNLNHLSKFLHNQPNSVFTPNKNEIEPEKPSMIPVPIALNAPLKSILKKPIQQVTFEELSDKINYVA